MSWQQRTTRWLACFMGKARGPLTPTSSTTNAVSITTLSVATPSHSRAATTASAAGGAPTCRTIFSPPANLNALVKRMTWSATTTLHRFYRDGFRAEEFNPGPNGNARFSPIVDAQGESIATIYAGTSFECAAMETVFHDVPQAPGLKTVAKRKLKKHLYSQLLPSSDLTLADLGSTALRKLGVPRLNLIESDKDIYPQTRQWAEAIHAQCADVQGLSWVSRQDDGARAAVLFKDRLPADPLKIVATSVEIVTDSNTYAALLDLADTVGVKITGK